MAGYDLVRPCAKCPFRTDIRPYLTQGRVEEIEFSLVNAEFPCHLTTDLDENDDDGFYIPTGEESHCAGALILLEKIERPSQMMRISERLGLYDRTRLDMDAPIFDDFESMMEAQDR